MKRAAVALVVIVLGALAARSWLYAGVVRRHATLVDDLPTYGDELRALPPYTSTGVDDAAYPGPGWYARRSPDKQLVAVTISPKGPGLPLSLLSDRPFLHTVAVWHERQGQLRQVVSIMEMDPHSGIAHRYAWSTDSRALLIHGSGRLPEDYGEVLDLCVVYLPSEDALYRLRKCPPQWQRGS